MPALDANDENAGFTLRLLLALTFMLILNVGAGGIGQIYSLNADALSVLRLLSVSYLIDAMGTIPSVRLNRSLRFDLLARAEIGSLVVGQGTAILMALNGLGIWSLAAGALLTTITGTIMVNWLSPWIPHFELHSDRIKMLLGFGLRYQSQGVLHLAIGRIIPAMGGLWLKPAQIGYLNWAQEVARWPRIPADYVARVGFPAFSHLKENREQLSVLLEDALTLATMISFPVSAAGILFAPYLIEPVFGEKWVPAIPALIILLAQTPFDALATLLLPVIYAAGDAGKGLRISMIWTGLVWGMTLIGMLFWQHLLLIPVVFVIATILMTSLIALWIPSGIQIRWWRAIFRQAAGTLVVGGMVAVVMARLQ